MKFKTISGSTYEVDLANKRMRRLVGETQNSARIRSGEWRNYSMIYLEIGRPGEILWTDETPPLSTKGGMPATITSMVESIEDDAGIVIKQSSKEPSHGNEGSASS